MRVDLNALLNEPLERNEGMPQPKSDRIVVYQLGMNCDGLIYLEAAVDVIAGAKSCPRRCDVH